MMTIIFILLKSVLLIARFTGIFSGLESPLYTPRTLDLSLQLQFVSIFLLIGLAFINDVVLSEAFFSMDIDLYIYLMREQLIDMNMYKVEVESDFNMLRKLCGPNQRLLHLLGYFGSFFYVFKLYCDCYKDPFISGGGGD